MIEHGCLIAQGQWLPQESSQGLTWQELRAVCNVLESVASMLQNQRIHWFTDNHNVARILTVGSCKPALLQDVMAIFWLSVLSQINKNRFPREANQQADFLSRIVDKDNWSVHPDLFQMLDAKWEPHTIDRFASYFNTQLPRVISRFWDPGSEAVDAFTCD